MTDGLPAQAFCAAVNHLLAQQPGLAAALKVHAGKVLRLELPAFVLRLRIAEQGCFVPAAETDADAAEAGRIRLSSALFMRLVLEGRSVLQAATASGDAHFLHAMKQIFSQLEWDAEADLGALLGPLAGLRAARLAQQLPTLARHGVDTLFSGFADYATEEAGWLARKRDVMRFNHGVDVLADDVARLEARLKRLERR